MYSVYYNTIAHCDWVRMKDEWKVGGYLTHWMLTYDNIRAVWYTLHGLNIVAFDSVNQFTSTGWTRRSATILHQQHDSFTHTKFDIAFKNNVLWKCDFLTEDTYVSDFDTQPEPET